MKKSVLGLVAVGALIAAPAMAADLGMPLKAPPAPVAPVATWTGCYVGGNVGVAWSHQDQARVDQLSLTGVIIPAPFGYGSETDTGIAGGGQVGCDYQFAGNWVVGVQGMFDWTDLSGSHPLTGAVLGPLLSATMNDKTESFDTATARLGYAFAGSALAYVKGGAAWVHNKDALTGVTAGGVSFLSESASWTATGWTVGGGIEYRFMPNWSIFAEYDYMDFGTQTIFFTAPPGLTAAGEHIAIKQNVQAALFGVNYRFNFGGGAIATRY